MADLSTEYLGKHKKFRIDSKKLATAFVVLAFVVAVVVFWWLKLVGITITGDAFCGLSEHVHSEDCYVSELVCTYAEETTVTDETTLQESLPEENTSQETAEATTEETTSEEIHNHTDNCYKNTLTCSLKEHTHSADCYPNFNADVETEADWLKTFEDISLSDSVPHNLLEIAKTQLGYTESKLNFQYDESGNKKGYTRYGEWYGSPYGNWNAMFVSFCLNYSNMQENESILSSNAETIHQQWHTEGLFEEEESHEAKIGELLFLDTDSDGVPDNVSVISEITDEEIKVIIGDLNNCVEEITIEDSKTIIGYGLTYNLCVVEEETTTAKTTTAPTTTEATTAEVTTTEKSGVGETTTKKNDEATTDKNTHKHTEACYTSDDILVCTEWGKTEPWALNWESEEFRDKAIKYVSYLINQLPDADEFDNKLNKYDSEEDYDGYEAYYKEVYDLVSKAYVNYENLLLDLRESVPNRNHLFEYEWLYTGTSTMAVTETRTVEFVNYYDNATSYKTVLIHSNNVGSYSSFGFYWWYAVVVDENEYGELVVTNKYGYELTNKSSLKPTTAKGFVLLSHGDSNTFDCKIGDEVTVNFDYLNSSGKNTSSFGTVTFSDYVPPETTTEPPTTEPEEPDEPVGDPVVEDIPLSDINDGELSDTQVKDAGGKTTSAEGDVEISKSIDGTDIENVFDITLTVRTESSMQTYLADPDMAVVIVMDISNTMNADYGDTSRYDAAVAAAESFMDEFAAQGKGISKLGFVAFNTHAHEILELQTCTTSTVSTMKTTMEQGTDEIISSSGYADSHDRFTNVEAGLKMGYDMLAESGNENKYIVFLSDGFPTTYLKAGTTTYEGYDPYTGSGTKGADGVFYDYVQKKYCTYGTSYSDKAAIRAREQATQIKNLGAKIFSIGIDIGGQTIQYYSDATLTYSHSIVDRTGTTYEIGDASSDTAYKNWLQYSIGSGAESVTVKNEDGTTETLNISYYHDSTDQASINTAFDNIFTAIGALNEESRKTIWTTTDPLPVLGEDASVVEFINFYDKDDNAVYYVDETEGFKYLDGDFGVGLENTAYHKNQTIYWDLKDSGYTTGTSEDGNTTYYYYKIKYRVRLYNENANFVEYTTYSTNGDAYLEYKNVTTVDDETTISDNKILYFEKPAVEGYYEEFAFYKQSDLGEPLEGAVFTLTHDDEACSVCHGNGKPVTTVSKLGPFTSQADGSVSFPRIPSGHIYILEETVVPEGYIKSNKIFKVTVALDELSIKIYESAEDTVGTLWTGDEDFVFTNVPYVYLLPETGGIGTLHFTIIGYALMAFPILYSIIRRKRERRSEKVSP